MFDSTQHIRSNPKKPRFLYLGLTTLILLFTALLSPLAAADGPLGKLSATFVGGPTVIIEIGGLRLITDPTLDNAGVRFNLPGNNHVQKLTGPAVNDVGKIDIVLLSHDQHPDNLDNAGRNFLVKAGKVITTKSGAERLGNNTLGLAPFESTHVKSPEGDEITITAVPARHGPYGIEKIAGEVTGFIITVKGTQKFQLYISGDTEYFSGIDEIAKKFKPEYAFVFAGAAQPTGPINVTMNSNDLIEVARIFPSALLIPIHTEGWSHYTQHNADYLKAFGLLGIPNRIKILQPGVKTELN